MVVLLRILFWVSVISYSFWLTLPWHLRFWSSSWGFCLSLLLISAPLALYIRATRSRRT